MEKTKSSHQFTVNLDGLNLPEQHLQRVNMAIQKSVMTELAGIDLNVKQGGLLGRFGPGTRGIIYIPKDLEDLKL
jgi:hypothetical protein